MGKEKKKKQEIEKTKKLESTEPSKESKDKKKNNQDKNKKEKPKTEIEKLQDKIKDLEKIIKEKKKLITSEKDKFAFLQAELENTRKYYIRQQEITKNKTKINTIVSFTPLIDSFEVAFKSKEKLLENNNDNCQMDIFINGFEKLYENLQGIFKSFGIKPIEKAQVAFDYRKHEVMMRIINDEVPEDTVLQIVQKGYKMNGEVIRPAKVVVSKKTPPPPEPKPEPEPEPIPELIPEPTPEIIDKKIPEDSEKVGTEDKREKPTPFE